MTFKMFNNVDFSQHKTTLLLAAIIVSKMMTGTKILIFEPPELVGMRETSTYFLMHAGMLLRGNQLFWYT